jgi:hypothetical protein
MVRSHSSLLEEAELRERHTEIDNAGSYLNTSRETRSNSSVAEKVDFMRRAPRSPAMQSHHPYMD